MEIRLKSPGLAACLIGPHALMPISTDGENRMEVWKDIAGFEGFYQVSNHGRVRSLTRTQLSPNGLGGFVMRTINGRLMGPTDSGNGYLIVSLTKVGCKRKKYYVHRLVADAFIPKRENCDIVNHLDHNRANNRVENLEWCSQTENTRYSSHLMRREKAFCKATNTGEKYISYCMRRKRMRYRVNICRIDLRIDKSFDSLDEAIRYRNEVMCGA